MSRFYRAFFVNAFVFVGLVFVSSPLAVFGLLNDVARSLDPTLDARWWDRWVDWARGRGALSGGA